ncbi:serine hydrolase [Antrihabitans stalactiti]|uniref:Beta-lactamase family protein n=1 Tax=Antrihabitans stalactiti TaxID=2584121 RepID=A0A848K8R2_9NOCA|nr:beta-lactamase family protein [Antrihabitans stalactiti]
MIENIRRHRTALIVLLAALVASCATVHGTATEPQLRTDLAAKIDTIVQARLDAFLIPGAVVAVSDPERGSYIHAYGTADVETGRASAVDDHFRIGSITKTFTATAVLRLADEGKLTLDDSLSKFVDGVPNGDAITLRNLLGMRGGVYDYTSDPEFAEHYFADPQTPGWKATDGLRIIRAHPDKATAPDKATVYNNAEYYLLGLVIEKVTGTPARDVINDLMADLGLKNSSYPAGSAVPAPASHGYKYVYDVQTDVTASTPPSEFTAAGAAISTVGDLLKYGKLLATGTLLKPETHAARTQFTSLGEGADYGLGLFDMSGWLGHGGDVLGYSTAVYYLPEHDATIAVAVNRYDPGLTLPEGADSIFRAIAEELYADSMPREGDSVTSPPTPDAVSLNADLQEALDPTIAARTKTLRVKGDEKDPELITQVANAFADAQQTVQVDRVTDLGGGRLAATVTVALADGHKTPSVIGFVADDGEWKISQGWACYITSAQATPSPACV